MSDRALARRQGLRFYAARCPPCGEVGDHWVTTGKCARCFTQAGTIRKPQRETPARAIARNSGRPDYLGECPRHGRVAFGVRYGKCLTCFTVDGEPRKITVGSDRKDARREGLAVYEAECPTHGRTEFYTRRGVCSGCFNGAGRPRSTR